VAGDPYVEADGRGALDDDRLLDDLERFLSSPKLGRRARRIEAFLKQVLHIGHDVGFAPGDEPVAADGDRGRAGQRGADDVEVARRQVREYHSDGTCAPRCGSLARSGLPTPSSCRPRPSCSSRARRRSWQRNGRECVGP
jgi:hypothetical protein